MTESKSISVVVSAMSRETLCQRGRGGRQAGRRGRGRVVRRVRGGERARTRTIRRFWPGLFLGGASPPWGWRRGAVDAGENVGGGVRALSAG